MGRRNYDKHFKIGASNLVVEQEILFQKFLKNCLFITILYIAG